MRFRKGGRYWRSEVEGLPNTPIILCVVVLRSYVTLSVSRSYVTRLSEVDTDFKNVFALKIISHLISSQLDQICDMKIDIFWRITPISLLRHQKLIMF